MHFSMRGKENVNFIFLIFFQSDTTRLCILLLAGLTANHYVTQSLKMLFSQNLLCRAHPYTLGCCYIFATCYNYLHDTYYIHFTLIAFKIDTTL